MGAGGKRILVVRRTRDCDGPGPGRGGGRCSQETLLDDLPADSARTHHQMQPEGGDDGSTFKDPSHYSIIQHLQQSPLMIPAILNG